MTTAGANLIPPSPRTLMRIYLNALGMAALGIIAAAVLFPGAAGLVSVFLFVLAGHRTTQHLLDTNRDRIWVEQVHPRRANSDLAWSLIVIFLGVLTAYVGVAQLATLDQVGGWFEPQLAGYRGGSLQAIDFGSFTSLLRHNALVLLICFAFALFYQHGGMLLVLAWNASRWGVVFSYLARASGDGDLGASLIALGRSVVAILPHLVLEALAYVLVAMAGVFLARALARHPLRSPAFRQVLVAVLRLVVLSAATLVLAAAVEAHLAPVLVRALAP